MNIRQKRISEMVELLLKKTNIDSPEVVMDKVASALDLNFEYKSFDDNICGCLVRKGGMGLICINKDHTPTRQRFTFAHEIGHYMMHGSEEGFIDNENAVFLRDKNADHEDPKEIEANFFAAELLMPGKFIDEDLKNNAYTVSDDFIKKIAARYNVSLQAMTIRLFNLGYPIKG